MTVAIRPLNGWVYARRLPPKHGQYTLEGLKEDIYRPDGFASQRVGNARAEVLAVSTGLHRVQVWTGEGWKNEDLHQRSDRHKNTMGLERREVWEPMDPEVRPGAVIVYRGYLTHANPVQSLHEKDLFLIHVDSILGLWVEEGVAELPDASDIEPTPGVEAIEEDDGRLDAQLVVDELGPRRVLEQDIHFEASGGTALLQEMARKGQIR